MGSEGIAPYCLSRPIRTPPVLALAQEDSYGGQHGKIGVSYQFARLVSRLQVSMES